MLFLAAIRISFAVDINNPALFALATLIHVIEACVFVPGTLLVGSTILLLCCN